MQKFEEKKFNLPKLKGISEKTIEEHLKLYAGYVKNTNTVLEKENPKLGFEFDGMRNHEYYFSALENGPRDLKEDNELKKKIEKDFRIFNEWLEKFKNMAITRGIGWAMLYYDKKTDQLLNAWVDEHHIGQLATCEIIVALDMWEHAFVADYKPSGKKDYINDFFDNLNWSVVEQNFANATK
ncbi:MAG: superoxide dismutase [Candidatus Zambryskibacteria bacterium]|nr:superoxide dismutase [Candidatus Zambryskibacteria bacterium]